ncbi:Rrf2 family transcriptional regulator [Candidatus Entotheonella palauensis]|uniref:Rrf2 family transcriptional regulator n=1 Tax=Candidatus Entotheonella gemina TaxID=1429439 RepID=W4MAD2_9BACT|nr:Rrf2 family transcriptional regulator [Candidatus Entotheonella palauensis]ETX07160.1 MAG: Rrf2 family transcriptional regulator [Candidatus Entotheonella gemina]
MQLTAHTDYALRVLMYLAVHGDRLCTIAEMASVYDISKNHLMKIVHQLGQAEVIETVRGRGGGLRLGRPPKQVKLGEVVRQMEPHFNVAECLDPATNNCPITPACGLSHVLVDARDAFLAVLDRYTLADIIQEKNDLTQLLQFR